MLDRYILLRTAGPLLVSLLVVLLTLLLDRLFRLFDLLMTKSGDIDPILRLVGYLIPHYVGLALPAAFFISVFTVMAQLGDRNEFDVLQSAGFSVPRIALPFVWLGVLAMLVSLALYGFIQPYSRYAYRAILHGVVNTAWNATLPERVFVEIENGLTMRAESADPSGRKLTGVFISRQRGDDEYVTVAATGLLGVDPQTRKMMLVLEQGMQVRFPADAPPQTLVFDRLAFDRAAPLDAPPFRLRGNSEREMTLPELRHASRQPTTSVPRARLEAEFHGRLIRALTVPLLPLIAVPMGIAAKRTRRAPGILFGSLILVVYHHALQLAESLGNHGRVPPAVTLWTTALVFAAVCGWLFHASLTRSSENPIARILERLDEAMAYAGRLLRRRHEVRA